MSPGEGAYDLVRDFFGGFDAEPCLIFGVLGILEAGVVTALNVRRLITASIWRILFVKEGCVFDADADAVIRYHGIVHVHVGWDSTAGTFLAPPGIKDLGKCISQEVHNSKGITAYLFMYIAAQVSNRPPQNTPKATPMATTIKIPSKKNHNVIQVIIHEKVITYALMGSVIM